MKTWKILFIVLIAGVIGFGILPLGETVKELGAENKKLFLEKAEKIKELKELSSPVDVEENLNIDPEISIPKNLSQAEIILDIQNISIRTGVILPDSWDFSITKDLDLNLSKIGVSFPIKGSRGSIYNFLKEVEINPRFMKIENLAVNTVYENNIPTSSMNVSLYAFSQENYGK